MATKQQLEKMSARQYYRNLWHTDLMHAISADCPYCCFATFCAPCASYMLRRRALYNDMSRYECCGGYMPCSGRCGESRCPEFCLCTEVFLCFANSVASTRFMLQDEFNIQTTKCDNCIIGFMFCLQQVACIFSLVAMIVGSDEIKSPPDLSCRSDICLLPDCPFSYWIVCHMLFSNDFEFILILHLCACKVCACMQISQSSTSWPPPSEPSYGRTVGYHPLLVKFKLIPCRWLSSSTAYPTPQSYRSTGFPPQAYPPQVLSSSGLPCHRLTHHPHNLMLTGELYHDHEDVRVEPLQNIDLIIQRSPWSFCLTNTEMDWY
ncbi:hypothetical protein PVL29_020301 [Vitis rotundifolia]|uniref:PLAC8 family protein n=1 Tax=Vitis rotundifolia TaxID=103349 RepID=A0AA39DDW2_VITRO|nr:hypothetical protein PVL29_020301 [Vitis rotundifolia]